MADVDMKPVEDKQEDTTGEKKKEAPIPLTPLAEIQVNVALIDKAVSTLEPRFTHRVLKTFSSLKKRVDETILANAISEVYPKGTDI